MNLDSKYFDVIRVARRKGTKMTRYNFDAPKASPRICDWHGCENHAPHPAPSKRRQEHLQKHLQEQRRYFCAAHISEYNRSYDFFEGMTRGDILAWQNDALGGHRPTWKLGTRTARAFTPDIDLMAFLETSDNNAQKQYSKPNGHISHGQKRALDALNLPHHASVQDTRTRYKLLVKRFHPDMNGGKRLFETRLQKTIKAYNYLKASGFC